jgi:hypothetical protein
MIETKIQGGLGNQIFQWAYGKSLSKKYNTDLFLDLNFYNNQSGNTFREFELDKFPNLNYETQKKENKKFIEIVDDFFYKELNYNKNLNYYLNGFWQSEKYFSEFSDVIQSELQPDVLTRKKLLSIVSDDSVSLHIRRTDYVTSNGFHPVQNIEYYNKALDIIGNYEQLLIFSDDINWCKENLNYKKMIFIENMSSVENVWLMSLCKNNIIANSSFSWWGAWLNQNKNKTVVIPKNWFGNNVDLNTSDIYPDNCIKI